MECVCLSLCRCRVREVVGCWEVSGVDSHPPHPQSPALNCPSRCLQHVQYVHTQPLGMLYHDMHVKCCHPGTAMW